jgi:glutamate/tyrosine decarboxylase-like PLP-dependent enzyme
MEFDKILEAIAQAEADIEAGPITPNVAPAEIRSYLASRYDFKKPLALDEVSNDVERMLREWQVQVTHPRYLGLFNPSVTRASVIADILVATHNPQLASWRTSPAANEIERHTLDWLKDKFGFPSNALANFTSGGAESNLSAVVVALTRAFPEYGDDGLKRAAASPVIYLTAEAHNSFNKITHMTGLGRNAIRRIATSQHHQMDVNDLARRVAGDRREGLKPLMVVGTAGTTAGGAIDPLPELAAFCRSEDLWFHVDAAWGGAAVISPRLKSYLDGIDDADSITCDAHKWFSVPMGAGMFFCRHADAVREAFRAETAYMPAKAADAAAIDPYTTTLQWSRRFIGLKLFLSLAHHGESGYVEMIEHQTQMGDRLRESLQRTGWRIVNKTPFPLVCFTRDGLDIPRFLASLYERQIAWMSEVRLDGAPFLRACITSFRTTEAEIEWVVRELKGLTDNSS